MQSQYERSRFSADEMRQRSAGLIHMMPLDIGCDVPDPILQLKFSLAIVELDDKVDLHLCAVADAHMCHGTACVPVVVWVGSQDVDNCVFG